jgi:hypothetical protein
MLQITIPAVELYDDSKHEFITVKEQTLQLEHSLVSLSKWESKWCKPFLSKKDITRDEIIDYIRCMTITQNVDPSVYTYISNDVIEQVNEYINAPMTATWFRKEQTGGRANSEQITSELVYYWMISLNIPFECQKWHFNRLLTLIRVCNVKSQTPKRRSKRDILTSNAALNEARRKQFNSNG